MEMAKEMEILCKMDAVREVEIGNKEGDRYRGRRR
jgi:hypothetical protein